MEGGEKEVKKEEDKKGTGGSESDTFLLAESSHGRSESEINLRGESDSQTEVREVKRKKRLHHMRRLTPGSL